MHQQSASQADGYDFFGNMDSSTDHVLEVESAHSGSTPKAGQCQRTAADDSRELSL